MVPPDDLTVDCYSELITLPDPDYQHHIRVLRMDLAPYLPMICLKTETYQIFATRYYVEGCRFRSFVSVPATLDA